MCVWLLGLPLGQVLTTYYLLLTTHYSLLTTHYSLLTTHHLKVRLCVSGFLDALWVKFCCKWKLCIICGLKWDPLALWEVACSEFGSDVRVTLFSIGGVDDSAASPPPGVVQMEPKPESPDTLWAAQTAGSDQFALEALGTQTAFISRRLESKVAGKIKDDLAGFHDAEVSVTSVKLLITDVQGAGGSAYLERDLDGQPEEWSGELDDTPADGLTLFTCVTVFNSRGLGTPRCSDAFKYDGSPPELTAIQIRAPVSGEFEVPPDCDATASERISCTPMMINSTTSLTFLFSIADASELSDARWSVSRSTNPADKSIFKRLPINTTSKHSTTDDDDGSDPDGNNELLEASSTDLFMIRGVVQYVVLALCDVQVSSK